MVPESKWQETLERWSGAGLIDADSVARIRNFESEHEQSQGVRWPVMIAIALGVMMVAAGVLLWVAAHWDDLSPAQRLALVLFKLIGCHALAILMARRSPNLALGLHALGTMVLGAAIFLTAQIFNLQEHWPAGILIWALGAAAGWWLLRHWSQAVLLAVLAPVWAVSEWSSRTERFSHSDQYMVIFMALVVVVYIAAQRSREDRDLARRGLKVLGAICFLPAMAALIAGSAQSQWDTRLPLAHTTAALGWLMALGAPLAAAFWLRQKDFWKFLVSAGWIAAMNRICVLSKTAPENNLAMYGWSLIGSVALIAWGVQERSRARVNLGFAAFGLTLVGFYGSNFLDKLGRSTTLIALGLLFLLGGWVLEKTRRGFIAKISVGATA